MRRCLTLFVVACLAASTAMVHVPVHADDTDPVQAAKDIADARDRANQAAQAYFDEESKIDDLNTAQAQLQTQIDAAQQAVDALEAKADATAVKRYTSSGSDSLPLLS